MRERFPGHYRPSEEEFAELWRSALVVPDTNVLLALYRLPDRSREKLLQILRRLEGQLFVPHQVAAEFQRRRLGVIEEQKLAYEKLAGRLDGFAAEVGRDMRRHPRLDQTDIERQIEEALAPVKEQVGRLREDHPEPLLGEDRLGADAIRDELDRIFRGRLGPPRDLEGLAPEGRNRYEAQVPPGYLDEKKGEPDCFGDLAIWLDVLDAARDQGNGVILITEERKEDWWWKERGEIIGPRPELVEELAGAEGGRLYLYGLERFMEASSATLELEFSDAEREEVIAARVEEAFDPETADWQIDHGLRERAREDFWRRSPSVPYVFEASPASGRRAYGSIGPTGPMGGLGGPGAIGPSGAEPGWRLQVRQRVHAAELEIRWEPSPGGFVNGVENRLTCIVTSAAGETASAAEAGATHPGGTLGAYLRFPDDFRPLLHPIPGTYGFEWFLEDPRGRQVERVAAGRFELGG